MEASRRDAESGSGGFRALLLAAGMGTRLGEITREKPKCLMQVGKRPLLGRWLSMLEKSGCEAVLINTHYLSDQVEEYLHGWETTVMKVETVHEETLLGTAGTLIKNRDFFQGWTGLLIHADNAMGEDLSPFLAAHEHRNEACILSMLTFTTQCPSECGIVEIDHEGIMRGFHEKVKDPPGDLANGAIYAFDHQLFRFIDKMEIVPSDFSKDILPHLAGSVQTYKTNMPYIDIGTPAMLERAQLIWRGN